MPPPRVHLPSVHAQEAEECLFCPKLCRHACPISTVDGRETTTPWGKMGLLALVHRGALPLTAEHAAPWWACTGCLRCAHHCDLGHEVAATLLVGRAQALQAGCAPRAAVDWLEQQVQRQAALEKAARDLYGEALQASAEHGYVPGCETVLEQPDLARRGWRLARRLLGAPVRPVADACCGLDLLEAGDPAAFRAAARRMVERLAALPGRVLFESAGCLYALRVVAPRLGVALPPGAERWQHIVELADELGEPRRPWPGRPEGPVRYHDPCKLGRGLGVYEPPRRVLGRLLGRPPEEFTRRRADAECCGAGGLLPVTLPEEAAAVAEARIEAHRRAGGGIVVTASPACARQLATRGAPAVTLTEWLDEALRTG